MRACVRPSLYFVWGNGTREWKCARNPLTPYTAVVKNSGGLRRYGPRQTTEINAARLRELSPSYFAVLPPRKFLRFVATSVHIIIMLTVVCAASSSSSTVYRPQPLADRISDLRWCQWSRTFPHLCNINNITICYIITDVIFEYIFSIINHLNLCPRLGFAISANELLLYKNI